MDVIKDNIDLMSISAHKMYGPKGVGALYVRRRNPRVQLTAQMDGGGHERGMRSGTLNVPGIVGIGRGVRDSRKAEMPEESKRMAYLRDKLKDRLLASLDEVYINGTMEHRLPNNLNISFAYRRRRVAADGHQRNRGIERIGLHFGHARTELRFEGAWARATTWRTPPSVSAWAGSTPRKKWITSPAKVIDVVKKLRELSPLYEMHKEGIDLTKVQWTAH